MTLSRVEGSRLSPDFMPVPVEIKITSEAQLDQAKAAESQVRALGAAGTGAAPGMGTLAAGVEKAHVEMRGLRLATTVAAQEIAGMDAGAATLSHGLTGLALGGFTPVGVALSAVLIGFGLFQNYLRDTKAETEKTAKAQKDLADAITAVKQRTLDIQAATEQQGKTPEQQIAIQSESAIRQVEQNLKKLLNIEGVTAEDRKRLWSETETEILAIRRSAAVKGAQAAAEDINKRNLEEQAIKKEIAAVQDAVIAQNFEVAAIGKTGSALANVTLAQKLYAIATGDVAQKDRAAAQAMYDRALGAAKLQTALGNITAGQQASKQFQSQFGVEFGFDKDKAAKDLAQNFANVYKTAANDPAIGQAIVSLIQQLSAMGTKNIGGLLDSVNLNVNELLQKTQGSFLPQDKEVDIFGATNPFGGWGKVGTEIQTVNIPAVTALDKIIKDSANDIKQWGQSYDTAEAAAVESYGKIGLAAEGAQAKTDALRESIAKKLSLEIDTSPAENAVRQLLDTIPERRTLILDVQLSGNALQLLQGQVNATTGVDPGWQVFP